MCRPPKEIPIVHNESRAKLPKPPTLPKPPATPKPPAIPKPPKLPF
jgi:hypothetical protein